MTEEEIVVSMKGLIKRGWCRGVLARNGEGIQWDPLDDQACCWCLLGALLKTTRSQIDRQTFLEKLSRYILNDAIDLLDDFLNRNT